MEPSIRDIINYIIDKMNKEPRFASMQEYYNEFNKRLLVALNLPIVSNFSELKTPHFKRKKMTEKAEEAKHLTSLGYSIRETMRIMNYKSPKSIQDLLKR